MNGLTLGRFRLVVQLVMLVFLLYGGAVMGHYLADKVSNALPALSCAYDQQNSGYCVLIPLQHQLHHRVGEGIVALQSFSFKLLLPLFFTLVSFFVFFVVLNKAFCGWICPLGTVQELLYRLGRWTGRPMHSLAPDKVGRVRPIKWFMLLALVFALPLLAGLGVAPHAAGDAYCQVCPSRIITTLANGDTEQLAVKNSGWADVMFGVLRSFLVGFVIVAALVIRQPFCRICPLLSFNAIFRRLSPTRLVKTWHKSCDKCGICNLACPMDIHEIWKKEGYAAFHEDCTLCGRCAEYCPQDGIIQIKTGPIKLFSSSRNYYKARVHNEKPDGTPVKRNQAKTGSQETTS
ncbi:MAG: 4Fe-4S binding protein [Gammaproteobacteria bacterium]|nr:MAG: 4Fe-4S binding protein [Gammaproteobacteria bacterium]